MTNRDYFQLTLTSSNFVSRSYTSGTVLTSSTAEMNVPTPVATIVNQAPISMLALTPTTTTVGTTVVASTAASYDPDGDTIQVIVSWGDGLSLIHISEPTRPY